MNKYIVKLDEESFSYSTICQHWDCCELSMLYGWIKGYYGSGKELDYSVERHEIDCFNLNVDVKSKLLTIYSSSIIKESLSLMDFGDDEDYDPYYDQYFMYENDHTEEMPKCIVSFSSYEKVVQDFNKACIALSPYIVFKKNNSKIIISQQDTLSSQDLVDQKAHEDNFNRWKKAYKLFGQDHMFIHDDYWMCPDDSVLPSRVAPYLDRNKSFFNIPVLTKKEIGYELRRRIHLEKYLFMVKRFLYGCYFVNVVDRDDLFDFYFLDLVHLKWHDLSKPITPSKLDNIANKLITGKDFIDLE